MNIIVNAFKRRHANNKEKATSVNKADTILCFLTANFTRVRLLAGVYAHVNDEFVLARETLAANCAGERFGRRLACIGGFRN